MVCGDRPDLTHIRIFGSKCMLHIPREDRPNKLSDKAFPATFMGYSEIFRSYLIVPHGSTKAIPARSVVFDELSAAQQAQDYAVEKRKQMLAAGALEPRIDTIVLGLNEIEKKKSYKEMNQKIPM